MRNIAMHEKIFAFTVDHRKLKCYQKSVIIFDGTCSFCRCFLSRWDRKIDPMVQAARSEKQNIVEGVMAWNTSSETMLKLLGRCQSQPGGFAGRLHGLSADPESSRLGKRFKTRGKGPQAGDDAK